ncbi:hypothetical protein ACS0TY_003401 [Phlomoides rotata]
MISWSDSECQAIENPDEAVLDSSYRLSVLQVTDAPHIDVNDRCPGTCMLCTEDKQHKNDSIISDIMLQLKEPHSTFHDQDYVEKIEEFQFYLTMVSKMVRPGCSPDTLNVVLSSMSSLVETLSLMLSEQYIRASL